MYKNTLNMLSKSTKTKVYISPDLTNTKYLESLQQVGHEWLKLTQLGTVVGFVYKNKKHVLRFLI